MKNLTQISQIFADDTAEFAKLARDILNKSINDA